MALLWKMICNLGDPMNLCHPGGRLTVTATPFALLRANCIYENTQTHRHRHRHRYRHRHRHRYRLTQAQTDTDTETQRHRHRYSHQTHRHAHFQKATDTQTYRHAHTDTDTGYRRRNIFSIYMSWSLLLWSDSHFRKCMQASSPKFWKGCHTLVFVVPWLVPLTLVLCFATHVSWVESCQRHDSRHWLCHDSFLLCHDSFLLCHDSTHVSCLWHLYFAVTHVTRVGSCQRPDGGVYSKRRGQVCIASTCLLVNFREASCNFTFVPEKTGRLRKASLYLIFLLIGAFCTKPCGVYQNTNVSLG